MLGEVSLGLGGVSGHSIISGLPVGGANLAVLLGELESLKETKGLINRAANRGLIENHVANNTIRADQVGGTSETEISSQLKEERARK